MQAQNILLKALSYWPTEIDISDGRLIDETNGLHSNNLILAFNSAEDKAKGSEWEALAVWVIYKLLHRSAKIGLEAGLTKVYPLQIPLSEFKALIFEELRNGSYGHMLDVFVKSNR